MNQTDRHVALMTILSAVMVEIGNLKEAVLALAIPVPPSSEAPNATVTHTTQLIAFVYSNKLKVWCPQLN